MKLWRFKYYPTHTLGLLNYEGYTFFTIERPWLDNTPYVSCISEGKFKMVRVDSPKFGREMWEISEVPNRTHILIHVANFVDDIVGCVGLGDSLFVGLDGVANSRRAITRFYRLTKDLTETEITIFSGVYI